MPTIERDADLIRQIAGGDQDALRELYAIYGQRLYAYAMRLTGDPATAEEAVQESLIAVWQGAGRFRGQGRVIAWLLGIVHYKALNLVRGRQMDVLEEGPEEPADRGPLPDEQAARSEQRRMISSGLKHLSLEHRMVLELVFYQGLSLSEVAEVCGCPVGTVKSRLNYAKNSLRGTLSRAGINAEDVEG